MQTPTIEQLNERGRDKLPGLLGIRIDDAGPGRMVASLVIETKHLAPNGYLHAGTVVTLADTAAGYGCVSNLPEGATGFTTIELKSNHLGTALEGTLDCTGTLLHGGRTTQVWDSLVVHRETGRTIATFRCTQLILYPR